MKKKKKKYRLQWFGIDETRTKDCSRTTPLSIDRGIRLKLPVHRFFFLTATNNRKEISTLCRLVEKSLVRGNRCIRSGIYNSLSLSHSSPFPFFRKMHSPREKSDGLIVGKFLSILFPFLTLYSSTIFNKIWWIDRFAFVIHLFFLIYFYFLIRSWR